MDRAPSLLVRDLRREFALALGLGTPVLAYVLATNDTAGPGLIALHALLLFWLVPPSVVALGRLVPPRAEASAFRLVLALGVRLAGVGFAALAMVALLVPLTRLPLSVLAGHPLFAALVPLLITYALAGLALEWFVLRERALRAEASEARARQAALAARVRPHFFFNALTCIEELTETDPAAARVAVAQLARLLRALLDASQRPQATLGDELARVEDYFAIERLRFGARLRTELDVPEGLRGLALPPTVLLTLAENAIKHGVEETPGPVRIAVRAVRENDGRVLLRVVSPRASSYTTRAEPGSGYGLRDVRERLALRGDGATLSLGECEGEVHVDIRLGG